MKRIITRGGRVAYTEMVNGKKQYYYEICKCGNDKTLKSSLCVDCQKIALDRRKAGGWRQKSRKVKDERIPEFVNRIQSRNGMASTYEIFVEMIDLYETNFNQYELDSYDTKTQIKKMWEKLKEYVEGESKK